MEKSSATLLLVEDEVLVGIMLAKKLRSFGYQVGDVATTGEEAILRAENERPDVILMDVTLSGKMNGIQAASEIKENLGIPIIIFTGYDNQVIAEQAKDINPAAVISKMAPLSELDQAIQNAVDK